MYRTNSMGVISEEEYTRLSKKFRSDLTDLKFKVEQLEGNNEVSIDNSKRLLELAQKAASLYSAQIPTEKRKSLNSLYSNSTWAGGELASNFRKPFDMIAVSNRAYQRKKATFPEENDLFDFMASPGKRTSNFLTTPVQIRNTGYITSSLSIDAPPFHATLPKLL